MPADHRDTLVIDLQDVVRTHQALVARVLRRAGVAERDVPDLLQEVFIVAHRRLPEWEGRAKLSTWLYRVAVRVASDHRRRAYQRHEALPGFDASALEAPPDQLLDIEQREQRLQLCAALDQLSDEHKQALLGYELEELSVAELAQRTQVPQKTVYSRLYAARRTLRQLLIAQGWAGLTYLLKLPRRCFAAWNKLSVLSPRAWLAQAPLIGCLLLLAPTVPSQPTPATTPHRAPIASAAPQPSRLTPRAATALQPTAAVSPKAQHTPRKHPARPAAPRATKAPQTELKVIHVGSIERPEGDLPFGFERIPEPPAPHIALRGPRDPVESLLHELAW